MKFGIDFGTTRIVVAQVDRGNYPLVPFETADRFYDYYPALAAVRNTGTGFEFRYGWDAWQSQNEPGWCLLRSLKRYLCDAGPDTRLLDGGILVRDLINGMARDLHTKLSDWSAAKPFEVMLGVPANANSSQRFLTMDAFRKAGFTVLGMLNEPSAAAIEFGHRRKCKGRTLVYDLGGGTFDASLVECERVEEQRNRYKVLRSEGINQLGGDTFDGILGELALGREDFLSLRLHESFTVLDECQRQKEALHGNTRNITLDLEPARVGFGQKRVTVAEYYARLRPLIEKTLQLTERVAGNSDFQQVYVTGGASELPIVGKMLAERFGSKVRRSDYMRSATAIGLAIQADATARETLDEIFPRHFGVWREADCGQRLVVDPIFTKDTRLPGPEDPPLVIRRSYRPVHNIGHFRFVEAARISENGEPAGDITPWDEIFFPFDDTLASAEGFTTREIARSERGSRNLIEEEYSCDSTGAVTVIIRNLTAGYRREYRIARWNEKQKSAAPPMAKKLELVLGNTRWQVPARRAAQASASSTCSPAGTNFQWPSSKIPGLPARIVHMGAADFHSLFQACGSDSAMRQDEPNLSECPRADPAIPGTGLIHDFDKAEFLGNGATAGGTATIQLIVKAESVSSETFGGENDLKGVPDEVLHHVVNRRKHSHFITLDLNAL